MEGKVKINTWVMGATRGNHQKLCVCGERLLLSVREAADPGFL
jgi:hypothetical protein